MPTIFFYGPEMEKEKKKDLIKTFTKKASELTGIRQAVVYCAPATGIRGSRRRVLANSWSNGYRKIFYIS